MLFVLNAWDVLNMWCMLCLLLVQELGPAQSPQDAGSHTAVVSAGQGCNSSWML
jgi:hypothetical protein